MTNMSRSTSPAEGKLGQALNFDGVDDYVDASTSSVLKPAFPFSVSTWVMLPSGSSSMRITTGETTNYGPYSGYTLVIAPSSIYAQTGNRSATCASTARDTFTTTATTLNTGQWYHVVAVFTDLTSFSIYVNGSSVSVAQSGNNTSAMAYSGSAPLRIGIWYDACTGTTKYHTGQADEVRVYNRALSSTEISALYNSGR
jgi:hypothetical protein